MDRLSFVFKLANPHGRRRVFGVFPDLAAPAGFAFLVDENGAYLVDETGAYLIAEVA